MKPLLVQGSPVQVETVLEAQHAFGRRLERETDAYAFEVRVLRAHLDESLLVKG